MKLKAITTTLCILSIFLFSKCNENDENSNIPFVTVDQTLNINNPANFAIQIVGGWVYTIGGSQGIIIYRQSDTEFFAFDRHSPYEPDNNCVIVVENTGISAEDPCSGSRFLLADGSVLKGPATFPLKRYQTEFDGTYLRIYN